MGYLDDLGQRYPFPEGHPLSTQPQETVQPGQSIEAEHHNRLAEQVNVISQVAVANTEAVEGLAAVQLRTLSFKAFSPGEENPGVLMDYFETYDPDDATLGTGDPSLIIRVAFPPMLRPSLTTHAGVAFSYTTNDARTADGTESQVVVPAYEPGDLILAIGPVPTGVFRDVTPAESVLFLDLNVDARGWAAEPSA